MDIDKIHGGNVRQEVQENATIYIEEILEATPHETADERPLTSHLTQSTGAAEYTDCISAEGKDSPNECPGYDTKPSDGEAPVMLELWWIQSTPLLPSLPDPPRLGVVPPDWVLSMD